MTASISRRSGRGVAGDQDGLHRGDTIGPGCEPENRHRPRRRVGRRPARVLPPRARPGRRVGCARPVPALPGLRVREGGGSRAATALSAARLASSAARASRRRSDVGVIRRRWPPRPVGWSSIVAERRGEPVDHQRGHLAFPLGQLLGEESRFGHGVGPGGRHQHVGRGRVEQELVHGRRPGCGSRLPCPRRPGRSRPRPGRSRRRPPSKSSAAAPAWPR